MSEEKVVLLFGKVNTEKVQSVQYVTSPPEVPGTKICATFGYQTSQSNKHIYLFLEAAAPPIKEAQSPGKELVYF